MLDFIKKLLGGGPEAQLKPLKKTIDAIEAVEEEYKKVTDEELNELYELMKDSSNVPVR